MWVLSARENAEKVWYSIIWEETKEASNVIDYNINPEITKDTSAVFNANNDTTTGMANVIPWVNAPKLIASTSIIGIDLNWNYVGWARADFEWVSQRLEGWESAIQLITAVSQITNERWYYTFKYVDGKWIIIPASWAYELQCSYNWIWSITDINWVFETLLWSKVAHTSATVSSGTTETFTINAPRYAALRFRCTTYNNGSGIRNNYPRIRVTITKK